MQKKLIYISGSISSMLLLITIGEIFARFYLGLGTPPLSIAHPKIEYMYKPNQDGYRFRKHFIFNQYGMRAESLTKQKKSKELRVLVFGDSVVNGGALTDQSKLATSILQDKAAEKVGENIFVGNISAGSWGPGNWLAYAQEYGFFGADIVVLIISSHDYADNPTFQPLNKNTHPSEQPISALFEGVERYFLPHFFPQIFSSTAIIATDNFVEKKREIEAQKGLNDLRSFLKLAKNNSMTVLVFQHYEKSEIESNHANVGNQRIKRVCKQLDIVPISLEPYFRKSMADGINPYRDNIHPNEVGQELIFEAMLAKIPNKFLARSNN